MTDLLTVTLNPALDMSTATPRVVAEGKLRCAAPLTEPGGGGANVARALATLGGRARAWIAVGGSAGREYRERFEAEGIEACWFEAPGDTRRTLGVTETETGSQFRFLMPGADWTAEAGEAALADVAARLGAGDWVVLSGSLPPGLAADWPRRLAAAARARGARAVLDTSGPALDAAAEGGTGAHVLRMDRAEAAGLLGGRTPDAAAAEALGRDLVARGAAGIAVITLAEAGAVAVSADEAWRAVPPRVEVLSATGAGDSFVAALVLGLSRGAGLGEALADAAAAAADAVTTPASALVTAAGAAAKRRATTLARL